MLRDLREQDTDVATIGQYLQPTRRNLAVKEYVTPEQFERYRDIGVVLGFRMVFSGPLVRSSYMADLVNEQAARERTGEGGGRGGRRFSIGSLSLTAGCWPLSFLPATCLARPAGDCSVDFRCSPRRPLALAIPMGYVAGIHYWFGLCNWIRGRWQILAA